MSLFHAGLQPALDSNGDPISGATWNFYDTGTTTPRAVYSDASLTTSLGSTVTANSAGRFSTIFLNDTFTYRAILKDAGGTTIKDIDPINGAGASASVLDFIPASEHEAIFARTSTTDVSGYLQDAIDAIDDAGGGELYLPAGTYICGAPVDICKNLKIRGAGRRATTIEFTHAGTTIMTGSGFRSLWTSNSSTGVYSTFEDFTIYLTHASNLGACFIDNCGTFLVWNRVNFFGGKYGLIMDQTEVSTAYACEFTGQLTGGAGLWIVNGADVTPGNLGGFTNQITIDGGCQFNQAAGTWAILNDGGYDHEFGHNNYNGGGLRFAGSEHFIIRGGEFESVTGVPILSFFSTKIGGGGVGSCSGVIIGGIWAATGVQPAIEVNALGALTLLGPNFSVPGAAACITGAFQITTLFARNARSAYAAVPVFDGYATSHDDGTPPVRTEAGTAITASISHAGALVPFTNASAITYTVPLNATVAFPIGSRIDLLQSGAGAITISPVSGAVTISGTLTTAGSGQRLVLQKTGTNTWNAVRLT